MLTQFCSVWQQFCKETDEASAGRNEEIARLLDLELDEVAALLPPLFLVSSKGDFLKKYTLRYADFLEKHQKEYKLFFYDEGKPLIHAFPSLTPEEPESIAVDQMIARWFLEH